MKRIITLAIIITLLSCIPVSAKEMTLDFGVVLNENGDGLLLDPDTLMPAHWFYNYISYGSYGKNVQVGEFIYTVEFLDEYGECESRIDYHSDWPLATPEQMERFLRIRRSADNACRNF